MEDAYPETRLSRSRGPSTAFPMVPTVKMGSEEAELAAEIRPEPEPGSHPHLPLSKELSRCVRDSFPAGLLDDSNEEIYQVGPFKAEGTAIAFDGRKCADRHFKSEGI